MVSRDSVEIGTAVMGWLATFRLGTASFGSQGVGGDGIGVAVKVGHLGFGVLRFGSSGGLWIVQVQFGSAVTGWLVWVRIG